MAFTFFKSVAHAFLYMHDVPSSKSSYFVYGGFPSMIEIKNRGVLICKMTTPRSRARSGRDAFEKTLADQATDMEVEWSDGSDRIDVIVKPPLGACDKDGPKNWNPFMDYDSRERDLIERCRYAHYKCRGTNGTMRVFLTYNDVDHTLVWEGAL